VAKQLVASHLVLSFTGLRRLASSGWLLRVALVRTDVSDELSASIIRVTRIGELGTTYCISSQRPSVASYG
jgi:hypothetical protein